MIANVGKGDRKASDNKKLPKKNIAEEMEKLKQRRDDRKKKAEDDKQNKLDGVGPGGAGVGANEQGAKCDPQFEKLIKKKKAAVNIQPEQFTTGDNAKIMVCVRKRPISKKEVIGGEIDCISVANPKLLVHECKIKIDGITKYIDDSDFVFDNTFDESNSTEDVFKFSVYPTLNMILNKGVVTVFAYGQTGSGKTYTMKGIQNQAIDYLFKGVKSLGKPMEMFVSFFEIYGGRLYDLLNNKNKLSVLEDKNQKVQIFGLEEINATTPEEMREIIELANAIRTTHNTVTNETSSRSHAVCNIVLREPDSETVYGKLTLVDLAGSERAQETQSNDRQRRAEGAEINKSLLALKECIRALDARKAGTDNHVPFRASKLTLVLRDSFIPKLDKSKIIMIACVSPAYSSSNHTINTLRYSDRLKEKTKSANLANANANLNPNNQANVNVNIGNILNKNAVNFNPANANANAIRGYGGVQGSGITDKKNVDQLFNDIREDNDQVDFGALDDNMDIDDKVGKDGNDQPGDEWDYLKKTAQAKDGKYLSDEFIKYHQITEKIIEDEDEILNTHMMVIKDDARMLTEEGELITNVRGVGESNYEMDVYASKLEDIIRNKLKLYSGLLKKIDTYKTHIREEDEIRSKLNPKYFIDD